MLPEGLFISKNSTNIVRQIFQANIFIQMNYYRLLRIGGLFFALIFLWTCTHDQRHVPVCIEGTVMPIDKTTAPAKDHVIDSVIALYRVALEEEMNEILAYSAHSMSRGTPEGLLNNFVADLCFEIGNEIYDPADHRPIDFCLLNYGGLRASIPEGQVRLSAVFELMPFENEMVVLTLTPEKVVELFDYLAASSVGMPVSGLRIKIADDRVAEVTISGSAFDASRNYKVLTSDYLAGGGDNMTFFLGPVQEEYLGIRIRDAIIRHLREQHKKGNYISSSLDGRIRY